MALQRLISVTGDHVIVRGWEGPGIKCVVEKIIVAKEQPEDSEFDAIHVMHELTVAEDKVGLQDFLFSVRLRRYGRALTVEA